MQRGISAGLASVGRTACVALLVVGANAFASEEGPATVQQGLDEAQQSAAEGQQSANKEPQGRDRINRVQQLYLEGMGMYRAGKHPSAIRKFEEAYRVFPDPKLMYNLARCYEANGDLEAAADRYRKTIEDPRAEYQLQQKARERLAMVQLAQKRSAAAPTARPVEAPIATRDERDDEGTRWTSVAKWVTGGTALGLLAGGGVLLALGMSDEGELDDARTAPNQVSSMTRTQAVALADEATSKQTMGAILLGTGAALAITSVVLFVIDAKRPAANDAAASEMRKTSGRSRLALGVTPLGEGGMLVAGGIF